MGLPVKHVSLCMSGNKMQPITVERVHLSAREAQKWVDERRNLLAKHGLIATQDRAGRWIYRHKGEDTDSWFWMVTVTTEEYLIAMEDAANAPQA